MLQRLLDENALDGRTSTAKLLQQIRHDLMEDAGGEAHLTHREKYLVAHTAGLLLIASSLEAYLLKQESLIGKDGKVEPVLGTTYLSVLNTSRLNLLAIGLKPPKPAEEDLDSYIHRQAQEQAKEGEF